MSADSSHTPSRLANLLVVAAWIAVAVIANVVVALIPANAAATDSALLPQDARTAAATNRIAQAFPGTGTNAIAYLVLEGRDELGPADQHHFDAVVAALRADTAHVGSVLDLWSDPLTAPLGTSAGGRSGIAMVWLVGEAGSAKARQSLDAARSVVRKVPLSPGLRARIAFPETTSRVPTHMNAWQAATIIAAAVVIAVLLLLRARLPLISTGIALLTAGLSLGLAWPLAELLQRAGSLPVSPLSSMYSLFTQTLAAVLTIGAITASTMLVARRGSDGIEPAPRGYRGNLPALALPGACLALLTGPLLLARTPALHSAGAAVLGVVVAVAASLTLLPALIGLAGPRVRPPLQPPSRAGDAARTPPRWIPRPIPLAVVLLVICALPVIGMRWGLSQNPENPANPASPAADSAARFVAGNSLPDVVLVESANDLRDPGGLIAIDQVSRRLMEIPGVRKVQSAAWPAGAPWADASLTATLGKLSDQLNRGAGTFMPQVNAIKTLGAVMNQMTGAMNELDSSMNAALAGANQLQQNVDVLLSGTRQVRGVTAQLSRYLDPVRGWMGGVANCPADYACSTVGRAVDRVDDVITQVTTLSDGADRIGALSRRTIGAFATAPSILAQMKSSLAQLQTFVPTLETTIQDSLPQIVQVSTLLKSISADFANTGEGGFYMSRKAISDRSYQHVRQSMFSQDGKATRLFVYSDGDKLDLDAAARAQQLETAAGKAMKYGSLADGTVTVGGAAEVAAAVRGGVTHDAVLLAVMLLAVVGLVGLWRGAAGGLAVGLGVLASYVAALGISIALWQHLLGRELYASVPLVSFALLAACGVPYLIAIVAAGTVSARGAVAPLVALGAVFGGGLVVVSGGSYSALSQVGTVLVIGLGALTALAHLCIPSALSPGSAAASPT